MNGVFVVGSNKSHGYLLGRYPNRNPQLCAVMTKYLEEHGLDCFVIHVDQNHVGELSHIEGIDVIPNDIKAITKHISLITRAK